MIVLISSSYSQNPDIENFQDEIFTSHEEVINWFEYYYLRPEPDSIVSAIDYIFEVGNLKKGFLPLMVFVGNVFKDNDDKLTVWLNHLQPVDTLKKQFLIRALWYANTDQSKLILEKYLKDSDTNIRDFTRQIMKNLPSDIIAEEILDINEVDRAKLWYTFLATGNEACIKKMIQRLELANSQTHKLSKYTSQFVMNDLVKNGINHKRVLQIYEDELAKNPNNFGLKIVLDKIKQQTKTAQD